MTLLKKIINILKDKYKSFNDYKTTYKYGFVERRVDLLRLAEEDIVTGFCILKVKEDSKTYVYDDMNEDCINQWREVLPCPKYSSVWKHTVPMGYVDKVEYLRDMIIAGKTKENMVVTVMENCKEYIFVNHEWIMVDYKG